MKTVAIIEGFFGGPLHTTKFRQALRSAGYQITKNRRKADVIIAHSAGIYAIPDNAKADLVILIGPTYWPGKRLTKRVAQHARTSKRYHVKEFGWPFYLKKELLGLYYFFRRHKYMWLGVLNNNRLERIEKLVDSPGRKTIIIRNADDSFTSPDYQKAIKRSGIKFVDLPGVHDHFAMNPEPYIDLIREAYN
ncbi:MAG TPA: hypothetical protein VFW90_02405 [Candidatus Saccharimonadales bacterium]|nr:hypothetical protein [Candidatus Saccharimonadales bacterium]